MAQEQQEQQLKRSKRHRMKRNNISDKARVEAVKQFGDYSREVEKKYQARYPKKEMLEYFK